MAKDIKHDDKLKLSKIIEAQALNAPVDSAKLFFKNLVQRSNLPPKFQDERAHQWTGNAEMDAWDLINWALAKGGNPLDPRYDILGSLLAELLPRLGLEDRRWVAAFITVYRLYNDPRLLDQLRRVLQVPFPAAEAGLVPHDIGPNIDWRGPENELELQGWFKPEPEFLEVGYLKRAIERASSVCCVEVPNHKRSGTGVLIARDLVLTNFHVLKFDPGEDIQENAANLRLTFGQISEQLADDPARRTLKLAAAQPIVESSPIDHLDFALLRVEAGIIAAEDIKPSVLAEGLPAPRDALSILQHPVGETMKLAMSANGVTAVLRDRGLVQYVTRAAGGSSGAPCFDERWQVIALHHAERARTFGAVREGILACAIRNEIETFLH